MGPETGGAGDPREDRAEPQHTQRSRPPRVGGAVGALAMDDAALVSLHQARETDHVGEHHQTSDLL